PEGIAVAIGLLTLAAILARRHWKGLALAILIAVLVFAAATLFRVLYFGQPVPNTFYAKVSSDRLQDLTDGVKYLFSFVSESPFAELWLILWVVAGAWAFFNMWSRVPGSRGLAICAATVFGLLFTYAALGGDHFALWRFYQPMAPLFALAGALGLALLLSPEILRRHVVLPVVSAAVVLAVGWTHYLQSRFDVVKEFNLVERALEFGAVLSGMEARPAIGVGPAGGIALAYDGTIHDLFGLNWVEMAHANPIKTGKRNHASFDKDVFWRHEPDLLPHFNLSCPGDEAAEYKVGPDGVFKGLYADARFQERYTPMILHGEGGECWPGFVRRDWLASTPTTMIEARDWSAVRFLPVRP
ncbi:MAG: hypothetical protein AAF074_12600, partial [Pseudomonadota bacterium]